MDTNLGTKYPVPSDLVNLGPSSRFPEDPVPSIPILYVFSVGNIFAFNTGLYKLLTVLGSI